MNNAQGFLVVLKQPETFVSNSRYQGVNRMPCYRLNDQHPIESEIAAMDQYILGDARDEDTGLILTHETALKVLGSFSGSPREFELIWCRKLETPNSVDGVTEAVGKRLGFDVAALGGDFWSIVADLPKDGPVAPFGEKLNKNGLFENASDAWEYMMKYQHLRLPDFDSPFAVLEVRRVR